MMSIETIFERGIVWCGRALLYVWVGCKLTLLLRVVLLSVWEGIDTSIDVCGCVGRQMEEMTELTKWIFWGGKL